jgi:hypothetical protein
MERNGKDARGSQPLLSGAREIRNMLSIEKTRALAHAANFHSVSAQMAIVRDQLFTS